MNNHTKIVKNRHFNIAEISVFLIYILTFYLRVDKIAKNITFLICFMTISFKNLLIQDNILQKWVINGLEMIEVE